jgi:hypothetical protein
MSAASPKHHPHAHAFRSGLSAAQVDRELKRAVQNWHSAEQCVVLWFAELHRRQLYKKLGFGTIHLYAAEALGFSRARSYQFLKLAEQLKELPTLRKAVASGELGWTKARAVATVATAKTQKEWLQKAQSSSRRELERDIQNTKHRARAAGAIPAAQMSLGSTSSVGQDRSARESQSKSVKESQSEPEGISEIPLALSVSLSAEQLARYETLVAQLRRRGHQEAKGELLLAALECLLDEAEAAKKEGSQRGSRQGTRTGRAGSQGMTLARVTASPYQVHIHRCPRCESAVVATSRGDQAIDRVTLQTALCDAKLKRPGQRTRSTLSPGIRRQVLERDRHRCRMPGCGHRQFLAVHHIVARQDGGSHDLANLITLCGSCHRALHALSEAKRREILEPVGLDRYAGSGP